MKATHTIDNMIRPATLSRPKEASRRLRSPLAALSLYEVVSGLMILTGLAVCIYLYFVISIVLATVERKKTQRASALLHTELAYIEREYSTVLERITPAYAHTAGFVDVKETHFATRAHDGRTLTLRTE